MDSNRTWDREFKESAVYRMDESMRMIVKSLDVLEENDLWEKPNASSNSVGNLMLHLCGNITQYILSSLGGTDDVRDRDKEFSSAEGYSKKELIGMLSEVVEKSKTVIETTGTEDLLRYREVQGFHLSGVGIVVHVVEHLSYHTGQIAFWTKLLKDRDLGFYDGIDLNIKNE